MLKSIKPLNFFFSLFSKDDCISFIFLESVDHNSLRLILYKFYLLTSLWLLKWSIFLFNTTNRSFHSLETMLFNRSSCLVTLLLWPVSDHCCNGFSQCSVWQRLRQRDEDLTPKRSYIICLASFWKPNYNVQGKCREEKSDIHRGHIEKVLSSVHLSRCFGKVLKHFYLTYILKPFASIFSFPLCLATAQKKLSEISPWRWHPWVMGVKLTEASYLCQQTVSLSLWSTWDHCRFMF